MAKVVGLGKGLNALIRKKESAAGVQEIAIGEIRVNPHQPRREFDESALEDLKESLLTYGLLQPIVLRAVSDGYELIAGERRLRAARLAGWKTIPALLREMNDVSIAQAALVENLQREDLNPLEEAEAYARLTEEFSLTQEEIARKVGRSRSYVANILRLRNLAAEVRDALAAGALSAGQARPLLALEDAELQSRAAEHIVREELSAREAEKLVKRLLLNPNALEEGRNIAKKNTDVHVRAQEEYLARLLGTQVRIAQGKKKGRIQIEYYTPEDFERILSLLTGESGASDGFRSGGAAGSSGSGNSFVV